MSAELWLTFGMFVLGVPGVYFGFRAVRSATKADNLRAHDALNAKLAKAAAAERELCRLEYEPQITQLQAEIAAMGRDHATEIAAITRELAAMTDSRAYHRGRADTLQETLNLRGST